MKHTTALLISFLRPEYTMACVKSLRENYPDIQILVGDNGEFNQELKDFINEHGGRYFVLPYDSGVSYARNRLMELMTTEYVLVGDDDFFYDKNARADDMEKFMLGHPEYVLIGGRISNKGVVANYQGVINILPDHLHYIPLDPEALEYDEDSGLNYQTADIVFNYFVARISEIKDVKWDENIKVAFEHSDWFLSLKKAGGRAVAFTPDPVVIHKPEHVGVKKIKQYQGYRYRSSDMTYFFTKHGIDYLIGFNDVKHMTKQDAPGTGQHIRVYYAKRKLTFDGKTYNSGDMIETNNPTDDMRPV